MHIQKRFVQTQRLDERRKGKEDCANLPTDLGVVVHPHWQEDALRAIPPSGGNGHCAMDAELASFVGCGADHASSLDAANDHCLATQLWAIALFDGRIKGV